MQNAWKKGSCGENSDRFYIIIITFFVLGDVMGSVLANLDSILQMPTGCGEQNMVKFAPNIYVLQYLTGTNQLTKAIEDKALNFLRIGT